MFSIVMFAIGAAVGIVLTAATANRRPDLFNRFAVKVNELDSKTQSLVQAQIEKLKG